MEYAATGDYYACLGLTTTALAMSSFDDGGGLS